MICKPVRLVLTTFLAVLTTGCATTAPAPAIFRTPPADCMLLCDPLTPPTGPSLGETMQAGMGAALSQKECARRHACLVEWVKGN